jgi:hypothetical protein
MSYLRVFMKKSFFMISFVGDYGCIFTLWLIISQRFLYYYPFKYMVIVYYWSYIYISLFKYFTFIFSSFYHFHIGFKDKNIIYSYWYSSAKNLIFTTEFLKSREKGIWSENIKSFSVYIQHISMLDKIRYSKRYALDHVETIFGASMIASLSLG